MIDLIFPFHLRFWMNLKMFRKNAQRALQLLDLENKDVSLKICDDDEMRALNRKYRSIDKTTDVLSFSMDFKEPQSNNEYLGDIMISFQTANKQTRAHHQSLETEMLFLFIHGLLHLTGYDHETLDDERKMFSRQEEIFFKITGKPNE